jgi:hypothetical protein
MLYHESCVQQNDIAVNNPITGKATLRKVNPGTWTRTIITIKESECYASGAASTYGPGGSGSGVTIKDMKAADGGTTVRPEQRILVIMGPQGK